MSVFDLYINEKDMRSDDGTRCSGHIVMGDFSESFSSSLRFWKANQYRRSWMTAIKSLCNNSFGVFFSDVDVPAESAYFFGYTAFCLDEIVYFQNMIFLQEQFNLEEIIDLNFKRRPTLTLVDDEGQRISTWTCPVDAVVRYLQRL